MPLAVRDVASVPPELAPEWVKALQDATVLNVVLLTLVVWDTCTFYPAALRLLLLILPVCTLDKEARFPK